MHTILPYEQTAKFYDYLLSHVNYKDWASYINQLLEQHKPKGNSLLDIACGTGSFLEEIDKYDYDCNGIELSSDMLDVARKKIPDIHVELANMLGFKTDEKAIITCLFDSINYLNSPDELLQLLNDSASNLSSKGILIFDTVTELHCLTHYFDYSEYDTFEEIKYERRCQYDIQNKIQRSTFIIHTNTDDFIEVHNQKIYSHQEIMNMIEKSNLNFEAAYPDFTFNSVDKKSERIHYVCRKKN